MEAQSTRYHYVGQLVLTVLLCLLLERAGRFFGALSKGLLVAAWYALAVVTYVAFPPAINHHAESRETTIEVLSEMRRLVHSRWPGRPVEIRNRGFRAMPLFPFLFPGWAAVFVIFHPSNVLDGHRVYFVDPNPAVLAMAKRGRRTKNLIVPPRPRKPMCSLPPEEPTMCLSPQAAPLGSLP